MRRLWNPAEDYGFYLFFLYLCFQKAAMTANEIKGELITILAFINEPDNLVKIKTFAQKFMPRGDTTQVTDELTAAQLEMLQKTYEQSNDKTNIVTQEEAHKRFAQWRKKA